VSVYCVRPNRCCCGRQLCLSLLGGLCCWDTTCCHLALSRAHGEETKKQSATKKMESGHARSMPRPIRASTIRHRCGKCNLATAFLGTSSSRTGHVRRSATRRWQTQRCILGRGGGERERGECVGVRAACSSHMIHICTHIHANTHMARARIVVNLAFDQRLGIGGINGCAFSAPGESTTC